MHNFTFGGMRLWGHLVFLLLLLLGQRLLPLLLHAKLPGRFQHPLMVLHRLHLRRKDKLCKSAALAGKPMRAIGCLTGSHQASLRHSLEPTLKAVKHFGRGPGEDSLPSLRYPSLSWVCGLILVCIPQADL